MTEEEIIKINEAIQIIKHTCENYEFCKGCPFETFTFNGFASCTFHTYPQGWKYINKENSK